MQIVYSHLFRLLILRLAAMQQLSNRKSNALMVFLTNESRCSDKALSNHKVVTDSFRSIYPSKASLLSACTNSNPREV